MEHNQATTQPSRKAQGKRAPRFRRNPNARAAWSPTARDRDIVRTVYHYRALTTEQIQTLLFPNTRLEQARKRLRALYDHHYVERIAIPAGKLLWAYKPVYRLTTAGAQMIADEDGKHAEEIFYWGRSTDRRKKKTDVTPIFLEHLLQINDVRIALTLAAQHLGCVIDYWFDENWFKRTENRDEVEIAVTKKLFDPKTKREEERTEKRTVPLFPDAYFQLAFDDKRKTNFFLELDRATESNTDWKMKVLSYVSYLESATYYQRFKTKSIRILTITTTADRVKNLKATTENARGKSIINLDRFLFTTFEKATTENILTAPIWYRATKADPDPIVFPEQLTPRTT